MVYKETFADLEEYSLELAACKAKKLFFKVDNSAEEIEGKVKIQHPEGTLEEVKARGIRYTAVVTLNAFGFVNPVEADMKIVGAVVPPKPDTLLVFSCPIAMKECLINPQTNQLSPEDVKAFNDMSDAGMKSVFNKVKSLWNGAPFEGSAEMQ